MWADGILDRQQTGSAGRPTKSATHRNPGSPREDRREREHCGTPLRHQTSHRTQAIRRRTQRNPHTATELIRAASERPNDHIYLSFDVANAVGSIEHHAIYESLQRRAPQLLPYLLCGTRPRTEVLGRRSSGVAVAFVQPLLAPSLAPPPSTHRSQLATLPQTTRQRRSRPSRPSTSLDDDDITTQDPPHDVTLDWKTILDRAGWQSSVPSVSSGGPQAAPSTPRRTSHSISRQDASHLGRSITDDFTVTMGEPAGTPPHQKRADQAASLAQSIAELVNSGTDFSARHVTFVLLQRCAACALEFDLRVCAPAQIATSTSILSPALRKAVTMTTATPSRQTTCGMRAGGPNLEVSPSAVTTIPVPKQHWAALAAVHRPLQDEAQFFNIDVSHASLDDRPNNLAHQLQCKRLSAPQLQAQLSLLSDSTRLRRLIHLLHTKGAWQHVTRIEGLCHTHVSLEWLPHTRPHTARQHHQRAKVTRHQGLHGLWWMPSLWIILRLLSTVKPAAPLKPPRALRLRSLRLGRAKTRRSRNYDTAQRVSKANVGCL